MRLPPILSDIIVTGIAFICAAAALYGVVVWHVLTSRLSDPTEDSFLFLTAGIIGIFVGVLAGRRCVGDPV